MELAKRGESNIRVSCYPGPALIHPLSARPPVKKDWSLQRRCRSTRKKKKNPEMASESSRQDYRMSEVKTTPVIFPCNPMNWQGVKSQCRKGMGNAAHPASWQPSGMTSCPTLELSAFSFNYINLSQRKFHETLWNILPKKCLKNPWPITFRD